MNNESNIVQELSFNQFRNDFPILNQEIKPGVPLIYLDSAATSQKPNQVLEAMDRLYKNSYANIHRGIHKLAEEATDQYEGARNKITAFINSPSPQQIIFTRNTTESINLILVCEYSKLI